MKADILLFLVGTAVVLCCLLVLLILPSNEPAPTVDCSAIWFREVPVDWEPPQPLEGTRCPERKASP